MVARNFVIRHEESDFDVEYDPEDGLEVFKFQLFSITSIPPDQQKIVGVDDDRIVSDDSDLTSVCDKLRVIEISDEDGVKEEEPSCSNDQAAANLIKSDEEFARMLQAEEEALLLQQYVANEDKGQMEQRLKPYIDQVLMYEDPVRQEAAHKTVNRDVLEEIAMVTFAKEGNFAPTKAEMDHAFLLQLLYWFKQSFRWVNAPPCVSCGSETTGQGMGAPLPSETRYGGFRVELYRCKSCSRITRFPRYNDPMKLLETREGRCGEWANCFTLYCRAFGYESRLILDLTDHVWTECFSDHLGRWMHLDPCEAAYDKPLLYEKGWNKKLNYVIAISKDGVYDVTKRYTRNWTEVLSRRNIVTESTLSSLLVNLTKESRRGFTSELLSKLEKRDRNELQSLQRDIYSDDDVSVSLPGRQSGDKEWRISRSEYGCGESNSSSSTSCPVRLCVDEHVTHIYNACGPILSKFVELSLPSSRAIGILNILKNMLIDLRKLPFKSRSATVNSSSEITHFFVHEMLPSFDELLNSLYLKYELVNDDVIVSLAGDAVRTSLALPVAIDVLEDMIVSFGRISSSIGKDFLSLPLLRLNRLCSGTTLASGEEPPLGIATSAFDGTRASKWEEPNGAKGCWIVYKLPDKEPRELVAYEIMSANDVPERDPKDWVVEGSEDGGSTWHILDHQSDQMFDSRFQRKTYIIESNGILSNVFRLRFLSVRDSKSNSRLQLGSIDLYAKSMSV